MYNYKDAGNFQEIEADFQKWDAFVQSLLQSPHRPYFDADMGHLWDQSGREFRQAVLIDVIAAHEQSFGYEANDITFNNLDGNGLWSVISKNYDGEILEVDAGLNVPEGNNLDTLQMITYAAAQNFLLSRYIADDVEYELNTTDIDDFNVIRNPFAHELIRLSSYPKADEFEKWLNRPSSRYALTAASYVSKQMTGSAEIGANLIKSLHVNFMSDQAFILTSLENTDGSLGADLNDFYRKHWQSRAQSVVNEWGKNYTPYVAKEAASLLKIAQKSGIEIAQPDSFSQLMDRDHSLKALSQASMTDAVFFVGKCAPEILVQLSDEARIHLLDTLGPQNELHDFEKKLCNNAAESLLTTWDLDPKFLMYHAALLDIMADNLRHDKEINELGHQWVSTLHMNSRWAFLVALNEKVTAFLGIPKTPLIPFDKSLDEKDPITQQEADNAIGMFISDPHKERIYKKYNVIVPEEFKSGPVIAINQSHDFGLLSYPTPMRASRVLIHEIGHLSNYHLVKSFKAGEIEPNDPLFKQAAQYALINSHRNLDIRLREEFTKAVYPMIQTEKFEYWLMDVFEHSNPFSFIDPK